MLLIKYYGIYTGNEYVTKWEERLTTSQCSDLLLLIPLVNRLRSPSMVQEGSPQSSRGMASTQSFITDSCQCVIPMSTVVVECRVPKWDLEMLDKCLFHTSSSTTCLLTLLKALYNVHHIEIRRPSRQWGVIRALVSTVRRQWTQDRWRRGQPRWMCVFISDWSRCGIISSIRHCKINDDNRPRWLGARGGIGIRHRKINGSGLQLDNRLRRLCARGGIAIGGHKVKHKIRWLHLVPWGYNRQLRGCFRVVPRPIFLHLFLITRADSIVSLRDLLPFQRLSDLDSFTGKVFEEVGFALLACWEEMVKVLALYPLRKICSPALRATMWPTGTFDQVCIDGLYFLNRTCSSPGNIRSTSWRTAEVSGNSGHLKLPCTSITVGSTSSCWKHVSTEVDDYNATYLWPRIYYDMVLSLLNICEVLRIHCSPFFLQSLVNCMLLCESRSHLWRVSWVCKYVPCSWHAGGGGEEGSDGIVGGDTTRCFPLSDAKVPVVSRMWVFVPWHPPASRQCRQHILRVHAGWSLIVVQSTFEHESEVLFWVPGGATVGCAEESTGRVGEDTRDDEAKREGGGDSVRSTHAKKSQWTSLACFL